MYKCYYKIGLRAHKIESILGSIVNTFGRAYVPTSNLDEILTLPSYKFCMSTLILKFETDNLGDL